MVEIREKNPVMPERHGGNVYRLAAELGISADEVIDFSASINPLGVPESVVSVIIDGVRSLSHYPDPEAAQLMSVLSESLDIDEKSIVCGNGSTELIYLAARALRPRRVLVTAPAFSEYERACLISKHPGSRSRPGEGKKEFIKYLYLDEESFFKIIPEEFIGAMEGCDVAFLCNPNNPTGMALSRDEVTGIANAAETMGCFLVVDEAFIDYTDGPSVLSEVRDRKFLIVLRSMTKVYALSGLRLGFGVFPLSLAETVKKVKEPWTVNALAMRAGVAAAKDDGYMKRSREFMMNEKRFLEDELNRLGIHYFPSSANFYLLRLENAKEIISSLRKKGILIRDCSNFRGLGDSYVRIAVKSRKDNMRLLGELSRP